MPTYPVTLPDGARVRLSQPQWDLLRTVVTVFERLPRRRTVLAADLWMFVVLGERAYVPQSYRVTQRMVDTLAAKGVLTRLKAGYRLAAGVREQVQAWEEAHR